MASVKTMTFVAALKDFFGLKDGQTLKEFLTEVRALDTNDREYFTRGLEQNGYNITMSAGTPISE